MPRLSHGKSLNMPVQSSGAGSQARTSNLSQIFLGTETKELLAQIDLRFDRQHDKLESLVTKLILAPSQTEIQSRASSEFLEPMLAPNSSLQATADDESFPVASDVSEAVRASNTFKSYRTDSYLAAMHESEEKLSRRTATTQTLVKPPSILKRLTSTWQFEAFFGLVICMNAVAMGLQVDFAARGQDASIQATMEAIQNALNALFLVELALRMGAEGRTFFHSKNAYWNALDFFLVIASVLELVLSSVSANNSDAFGQGSNVRIFRIIKITRLIRFFRVMRFLRFVRALRCLLFSIMTTLRSLMWSIVLMLIIIFVFSVMLTDMVTTHRNGQTQPVTADSAEALLVARFGTLLAAMRTLFACVLNGLSWTLIADALDSISMTARIVFECYVSFTVLAFLNVVTAVFCQSAIESAQRDHDLLVANLLEDKQFFLDGLKRLFDAMDDDNSGNLSLNEFEAHFNDRAVKNLFEALSLNPVDAWSLFSALDRDNNHTLNAEEFLDGCIRLRGSATAIDMANLKKDIRKVRNSQTSEAA